MVRVSVTFKRLVLGVTFATYPPVFICKTCYARGRFHKLPTCTPLPCRFCKCTFPNTSAMRWPKIAQIILCYGGAFMMGWLMCYLWWTFADVGTTNLTSQCLFGWTTAGNYAPSLHDLTGCLVCPGCHFVDRLHP